MVILKLVFSHWHNILFTEETKLPSLLLSQTKKPLSFSTFIFFSDLRKRTGFAIEAQTHSSLWGHRIFPNPSLALYGPLISLCLPKFYITITISSSSHSNYCLSASSIASMVQSESLHDNPLLKDSEIPPFTSSRFRMFVQGFMHCYRSS